MEKEEDVPNARDELRKLQAALKRKAEADSSADEIMANKGRASRQERDETGDVKLNDKDEQTADNFATAQANRMKLKR